MISSRRNFLKAIGCAGIASAIPSFAQANTVKKKPNVILIMTDDQG